MPRVSTSSRALAVALCCAGCWTTKEEGKKLRAELEQVKAESKAERERLAAQEAAAIQRIDAKIAEVSTTLDELNRSARRSGADLGVQLDQEREVIARLQGALEETQHKLAGDEQASAAAAAAIDAREKRLAALEAWVKARQAEIEKEQHPQDRQAIYELALRKVNDGETARGLALFQEFLEKFPKDALAPNAQYWIGEAYYAQGDFANAIMAFQQVLKDHPKADKVPDAYVGIGKSFQAQKKCEKAEPFFEEVVQSYGSRPAARIAKEKLAECKKASPKGRRGAR